jgi:hypothetical protein
MKSRLPRQELEKLARSLEQPKSMSLSLLRADSRIPPYIVNLIPPKDLKDEVPQLGTQV